MMVNVVAMSTLAGYLHMLRERGAEVLRFETNSLFQFLLTRCDFRARADGGESTSRGCMLVCDPISIPSSPQASSMS